MLWWKIRQLKSGRPATRRKAATELWHCNRADVTKALAEALRDSDAIVRKQAALTLQRRGWRPATDNESAWFSVSLGDYNGLAKLGSACLKPLLLAMRQNIDSRNVCKVLIRLSDEKAKSELTASLIDALNDNDSRVVSNAIEVLRGRRERRAVPDIVRIVTQKKERWEFLGALAALEELADASCLVGIRKLMAAEPEVRHVALRIINRLDPESIVAITKANLARWGASGSPERWIVKHKGEWGHQNWLDLIRELEVSPFWPMNTADVGKLLEERRHSALFEDFLHGSRDEAIARIVSQTADRERFFAIFDKFMRNRDSLGLVPVMETILARIAPALSVEDLRTIVGAPNGVVREAHQLAHGYLAGGDYIGYSESPFDTDSLRGVARRELERRAL